MEIDEELTRLNNGVYPADNEYKVKVLTPRIVNSILKQKEIIFFTNTNYFSISDLRGAHKNGFTIIQLHLSLAEATKRNWYRVNNEGYSDLSEWLNIKSKLKLQGS